MTVRLNAPLRVAAVAAASALVGISFLPAASAADGNVEVVNTETVQVYTDATGKVQTTRVYEQLSLTGNGSVELVNPIETDGLRNLDEFGRFDVRDGNQVTTMTVDGEKRLRSVSDYDGDLPLTVDVQYFLDGTKVEPGDVVGADGRLEVLYTVTNVTAQPQEVSFPDGNGGTVTKTVDVPIPMVGSLSTVAPDSFTDVQSEQANMAGDGRGGTKLSFTMTLFPPLGADSVDFGYSANITDGVVPRAEISALPLNPLESPTFQTAATSYQGGADTGAQLADGAATIDENLLKLRDGAGELLAGLIRLRDGSEQLEQGLAGEAAPGAARLADGAAQLSAGLGEIDSGAGRLADGAGRLRDGVGQLADGADRLDAGAGRLEDGTTELLAGTGELMAGAGRLDAGAHQLAGGTERLAEGLLSAESKAPALIDGLGEVRAGLVQVNAGLTTMYNTVGGIPAKAQPLFDGIQQLIAGIGSTSTPDTLLFGVNGVRAGLTAALPKIQQMADGVYKNDLASPGAYQKLDCALTVLKAVKAGTLGGGELVAGGEHRCFVSETNPAGTVPPLQPLDTVDPTDDLTPGEYRTVAIGSVIEGLLDGQSKLATVDGAMNETTLHGGLLTLKEQLQHFPNPAVSGDQPGAIVALAAVQCGLDNTSLADVTLPNGLPGDVVCKRYTSGPNAGAKQPGLKQGLLAVNGGVGQLVSEVVSGIQAAIGQPADTPATTPKTLRGGINGLIGGVDLIAAGGGDLLEGLGLLADGSVELSAGAGQLADGTQELGAGTKKLNAGAGRLADGAEQLAAGTGDLEAGVGRLADGSVALADGAGLLADGAGEAKDGADQIADGAGELAGGLGDAANGSSRVTEGLETAAEGAPKLVDGAERLSNEGTKKLVEAGVDTAQNYGQMYATIAAGAERAKAEKMAYGAPEGAMGLTAYSFVIEGEDGEGGRNLARGLAGLGVLGASAGAFALRRRFI